MDSEQFYHYLRGGNVMLQQTQFDKAGAEMAGGIQIDG
jgi:hypothetical protein